MGKVSEPHERPRHALFSRGAVALFALGLCVILIDKALYAYADIVNNTRITRKAKLCPLYQPMTLKRFARRVLHIEVNREKEFKVNADQRDIHYPKEPIRFDPLSDKKYNFEVRNKWDYTLISNAREMARQKKAYLADAFRRMSEFYR